MLRHVVGILLRIFGVSLILREIFHKNKATIIVYHDPSPEVFKKHVEYLSKRYNFISQNELVNAIRNKDWSHIPEKSLVFTIDDGHKGNYRLLEIFKTYKIKPTLYLCSHIINTNRHFWWKTGYPRHQDLKKFLNKVMLKLLRDKVHYEPKREYQDRQALNLMEIEALLPYVDFGSHTKFHPILTMCAEDKCINEIKESKEYLELLLGKPIVHFAYTDGSYSTREEKFAISCGYKSIRTLDLGWNDVHTNPNRLKVTEVEDNASLPILIAQMSGIFPYLRSLCSGIHGRFH